MTDEAWSIQVSAKLPDQTLINIRGNAVSEVLEQLGVLAANSGDMTDSLKLITAAGAAVNAAHAASKPAPAGPAPAAWTPPQGGAGAAPAASQPGAAPSCDHGPREYKTGEGKNGKTWKAWFCIAPKGSSCPAQWLS